MIGSNGNLTLQAGATTNSASGAARSSIWSAQTASVTSTSFTNSGVLSGGNVTLNTTTDVTNAAGATIEASGNLSITTTADVHNAGELIANQTLNIQARNIGNTGRLDATDQVLQATNTFTNAAGASVTASNSIEIGATTINNRGLINANDAAGASQVHLHATTVHNTATGAIFGDRIAIAADTLNNRPDTAGATAPVIAAREQLHIGARTLNNEDGAFLYSGGSMAIGGALDASLTATGQMQALNNLSAEIEALDNLRVSALTLTNERRGASVSQVQVAEETATLGMPAWWVNGKNYGWLGSTSNHNSKQYYLLDPASIVSETPVVTPDGNLIYKVEVLLAPTDSVYQIASGSYAGAYGARDRITVGAGTAVLYVETRQTGVSNPDQVAGAPDAFTPNLTAVGEWQHDALSYNSAYGRCTTNCTLLVVQTGYSDPSSTMLRNTQRNVTGGHDGYEISRTAHHTVVEDRLNPGAGTAAAIRSGGAMQLAIGSALTNSFADILAGGVLDLQATGATVSNTGQTLKRTHRFQITSETVTGEQTTSDVENHASYKAEGYSVSATVAGGGPDPKTLTPEQQALAPAHPAKNEGSAGIGEDSGEARSTTQAAISGLAGNTEVRDDASAPSCAIPNRISGCSMPSMHRPTSKPRNWPRS